MYIYIYIVYVHRHLHIHIHIHVYIYIYIYVCHDPITMILPVRIEKGIHADMHGPNCNTSSHGKEEPL